VSWTKITCTEREAIVDRHGRSYNSFSPESGICVTLSRTDPDGDFGKPEIFTEWGFTEERPVLQDYLYPATDKPCEHYEWIAGVPA
jgi:hypothetical protein